MRRQLSYWTLAMGPTGVRIDDDPATWLPAPAELLDDGSHRVRLRAEGVLGPLGAGWDAVVSTDEPLHGAAGEVVRHLSWRAERVDALFPTFEGEVTSEPTGTATRIAVFGSYRPVLSVVGEVGDALVGRRVAEATLRCFCLDVAAALSGEPAR